MAERTLLTRPAPKDELEGLLNQIEQIGAPPQPAPTQPVPSQEAPSLHQRQETEGAGRPSDKTATAPGGVLYHLGQDALQVLGGARDAVVEVLTTIEDMRNTELKRDPFMSKIVGGPRTTDFRKAIPQVPQARTVEGRSSVPFRTLSRVFGRPCVLPGPWALLAA